MRLQDNEIVTATCVNTMEAKDVNGGTAVTDIKFSPPSNDATNSNGILSPPTTPSTTTPSENEYASSSSGSGRFKFFKGIIFNRVLLFLSSYSVNKTFSDFVISNSYCRW